MDAPPIQYAKTSDGVSIAYWAIGEGPPLVILGPILATHIQMEWEFDIFRAGYERLAEKTTVIRFDHRGLGLSQADCLDLSAVAQTLDLEAVVDHLRLERFALYGPFRACGEVLFAYPRGNPDRVSHLIVSTPPFPRGYLRRIIAIQPLMDQEWELYTDIFARLVVGWDEHRAANLAMRMRAANTPASFAAAATAMQFSPEPMLPAIRVPALILHALGNEDAAAVGRMLAAGISGAHLVGVPNWPMGSMFNETTVTAVVDFINTAPAAPGAPIPPPKIDVSAVRTIVFTDVEGSTALNERLGDEGARKVLREHERLTREALGAHGGSEVKAMGDGFMAWFPSATRAVECAIALQKAFDARNTSETEPIHVRIGINAGEPIAEGDDLFGASIIATARIAAQATGGQILASDVVRQLLAGKGFTFADQGEHALKGFDEPARLYEVRWQESD